MQLMKEHPEIEYQVKLIGLFGAAHHRHHLATDEEGEQEQEESRSPRISDGVDEADVRLFPAGRGHGAGDDVGKGVDGIEPRKQGGADVLYFEYALELKK